MNNTYHVHDNGARPFKVVVIDKHVQVYRIDEERTTDDQDFYNDTPLLTFDCKKVFVGKHIINTPWDPKLDGNSLLLELDDGDYVYIGRNIFKFKPLAQITRYYSEVGNSNVPYPYAVDSNDNCYLLIEDAIVLSNIESNGVVPNRPGLQNIVSGFRNAYDYYYEQRVITKAYNDRSQPPNDGFKDIKNFYIDGNEYDLNWSPESEKNYARFLTAFDEELEDNLPNDVPDKGVYIRLKDGTLQNLNKQQYVDIMEEFGQKYGLQELKSIELAKRPGW